METEQALEIVNAYGAVLEKTAQTRLGAPISMLPTSKEDIKKALKFILLIMAKDETVTDQLKAGYVMLAKFVPDGDATIVEQVGAVVSTGDDSLIAKIDRDKLAMAHHVMEEQKALSREITEFLEYAMTKLNARQ